MRAAVVRLGMQSRQQGCLWEAGRRVVCEARLATWGRVESAVRYEDNGLIAAAAFRGERSSHALVRVCEDREAFSQ